MTKKELKAGRELRWILHVGKRRGKMTWHVYEGPRARRSVCGRGKDGPRPCIGRLRLTAPVDTRETTSCETCVHLVIEGLKTGRYHGWGMTRRYFMAGPG